MAKTEKGLGNEVIMLRNAPVGNNEIHNIGHLISPMHLKQYYNIGRSS